MMHTLKAMVSTGRDRLPVLLAHQATREGLKLAQKLGRLELWHLAESSEVEKTADWVFALYQSQDQRKARLALLQTLAARREDLKHFLLQWEINTGTVIVRNEVELG
jgi:hypothetical protein